MTRDVNLLAMSSEAFRHVPVCRTDVQLLACALMFIEHQVRAFPEVMPVFVPKFHTEE